MVNFSFDHSDFTQSGIDSRTPSLRPKLSPRVLPTPHCYAGGPVIPSLLIKGCQSKSAEFSLSPDFSVVPRATDARNIDMDR